MASPRPQARHHRQARRVAFRVAGDGNRHFVARNLPLDAKLPFKPPDAGVPARDGAGGHVKDVEPIVVPLNVGPLVNHHAIELVVVEPIEQQRRHGDHRRAATQDGRRRDPW